MMLIFDNKIVPTGKTMIIKIFKAKLNHLEEYI